MDKARGLCFGYVWVLGLALPMLPRMSRSDHFNPLKFVYNGRKTNTFTLKSYDKMEGRDNLTLAMSSVTYLVFRWDGRSGWGGGREGRSKRGGVLPPFTWTSNWREKLNLWQSQVSFSFHKYLHGLPGDHAREIMTSQLSSITLNIELHLYNFFINVQHYKLYKNLHWI